MTLDPKRAMVVAKSWAKGTQHSNRRKEDTDFKTLEEYIPYRVLDVGYIILLLMLWHGLVTFGYTITIPNEEADMTKELLMPALITASLTNGLYSFEKEKGDANVQNAVLVVMKEHGCSEKKAREICKDRIRVEVAKYIRVVKDTRTQTDISDEVKRYVEVMQYTLSGNVAWSTQYPRYNNGDKFNKLQMLRGEYGLENYPATWPPKDADGLPVTTGLPYVDGINGNGVHQSKGVDNHTIEVNGQKRKRSDDDVSAYGTSGVKKLTHGSRLSADSLILEDVVSLALDWNLLDLSDNVSWTHFPTLSIPSKRRSVHEAAVDSCSLGGSPTISIPTLVSLRSKGFQDQALEALNIWLKVPTKSAKMIKNVVKMLHGSTISKIIHRFVVANPLRRGKPSTHNIYGAAQTINSATYQYTQATGIAAELSNPSCFHIFHEEMQQLHAWA
ncbi:MAG: hypothetical protein Q9195_002540 [Heterodermia aff. obscurata]